jgi:hypothetical protein
VGRGMRGQASEWEGPARREQCGQRSHPILQLFNGYESDPSTGRFRMELSVRGSYDQRSSGRWRAPTSFRYSRQAFFAFFPRAAVILEQSLSEQSILPDITLRAVLLRAVIRRVIRRAVIRRAVIRRAVPDRSSKKSSV